MLGAHLFDQIYPVGLGHYDVRDDHVRGADLNSRECRCRTVRHGGLEARPLQDATNHVPDVGFIIDNKHASHSAQTPTTASTLCSASGRYTLNVVPRVG